MVQLVKKVSEALGLWDGPVHAEVIDAGVDPYLIEVSNRGGGYYLSDKLVPAATGISPNELTIMLAADPGYDPVATLQSPLYMPAALHFLPAGPGRLQHLDIGAAS